MNNPSPTPLNQFEEFLRKSPFKDIKVGDRIYVAMFGAFMGGYIECQKWIKDEIAKKKS